MWKTGSISSMEVSLAHNYYPYDLWSESCR